MGKFVLAIDQGTTGSTCLLIDMSSGVATPVGKGYSEFPQYFPTPGWVEHDLDEIWQSTIQALGKLLSITNVDPKDISAIGVTNQRETSGLWDTQGKPAHRAIVWQDRRTAEACAALKTAGHEAIVRKKTGLLLDPYFSGTKLAWLLNEGGLRKRAESGELRFGTIDTWLVHKLTDGAVHVTDESNASRTMLFDIHKGAWDTELCALLGDIPVNILPSVRTSSEVYGHTKGVQHLPDGIPIAGIAGDQQAALFGQACFDVGMAKCTYGTGAFALINTGVNAVQSDGGLLTTIAWKLGTETTYALEGSCFIAGAIVQWLRDGLNIIQTSAEVEVLAQTVPDAGGVILVPALTGLGAPHWRPHARGVITGITRGTTKAHIARAALDGIALQVGDLLGGMRQESQQPLSVLRVDGGAAANNLLMQFQSDILGVEIHRPQVLETTALGAGYLAALGVGLFSSLDEVKSAWKKERVFTPSETSEDLSEHVRRWRAAVEIA